MRELEDRIRRDGRVLSQDVLQVDSFLNHECDVQLFDHMGAVWAQLFEGHRVDKILTIEASGIAIACLAALHFNNVPVVFAKKSMALNLSDDQYHTTVFSFTKQREYPIIVSKRLLTPGEHVLLIDDFLANGQAMQGLLALCEQAQVVVEGIGIAVEKAFQRGGGALRESGYHVESLAVIDALDPVSGISFGTGAGD